MTNSYPLSSEEFRSIYSRVPRLCVEVIIYTPEKGILLTRRSIEPAKGSWHTPGGGLLYKESLENAVKRIAKKELGIDIEVVKQVGIIEASFEDYFYHDVSVAIEVKSLSDEFTLDEHADEVAFFKELPSNLIPAQRDFLEKYMNIK